MNENVIACQLPEICCRCGEKQGVKTHRINNSRVSGFGYFIVAFSVKRSLYSFGVPVCDDCFEKLKRSDKIVKTIRIAISLFIAGWFLYNFISVGHIVAGSILSIAIYVILHFAIVNRPISGNSLGNFTGEYFWFSNKEFFRQFAELNPKLVAPYRFQPVVEQPPNGEKQSRFSLPDRKLLIPIIIFLFVCFGACVFWFILWQSSLA